MLWEILTRQVPYDGIDPGDIRSMVLSGKKLDVPFGLDKKLADLIAQCRALEPSARPDFGSIVDTLRGFL